MSDELTHFLLLYPSRYLRAADLQGRDVALTIRQKPVREELVMQGGKKERKPILYFEETRARAARDGEEEKRMTCNITNARIIAALHGDDPRMWPGKRIMVFPTTCSGSKGEIVDCIRIRPIAPPPAPVAAPVAENVEAK